MDPGLGITAIELGQEGPGMVQQRDTQVRALGRLATDELIELPAAQQQAAVIFIAAGHPGGVETGDV